MGVGNSSGRTCKRPEEVPAPSRIDLAPIIFRLFRWLQALVFSPVSCCFCAPRVGRFSDGWRGAVEDDQIWGSTESCAEIRHSRYHKSETSGQWPGSDERTEYRLHLQAAERSRGRF